MVDLLRELNAAQREAVTATEGFVRVIAGAGSGKTRALSHRFAYLVGELGILPGNILCVTFTNKSANEMRQRIHQLTGDNDTGYINTFHGFCVSILQEDSHAVQYPKSFLVLDNSDIDAMLQIIYEERGLTLRDMTYSDARDMIEMEKLSHRPDYYRDMIDLSLDTLKEKYDRAAGVRDIIFYGYLYQEKKCFGLDYNDLIKFSLYIFQQNEDIRLKWQRRLEYIMIDEFQDIDQIQYQLMEVLCGYHRNLFVVGDPDQTIYTWRGANVKYLLEFDKRFPGTRTILMMDNYRSTPEILAVANSLIAKNRERIKKDLIPTLPPGSPVLCHLADTQCAEADWIAGRIKALHDTGVPYRDMAVLYRAHYVTRAVEEALLREKLPYTIYSGVQFFGRMEIKDALSYLRMIAYQDDLSFLRVANVPKRNLGKRRMAFLQEYAQRQGCSLYRALRENLDEPIFKGTRAASFLSLIDGFSDGYEGPAGVRGTVRHLERERLRKNASHRGQPGAAGQPGGAEAVGIRIRDHLRRGGHLRALPGPRGPVHQRRRPGPGGQGEADDRSRRQGAGVPPCVPVRHERGDLPLPEGADLAGDGGGAAAGLRGPDPGGAGAVPVRLPGAQLRRVPPVPLPVPAGHRPGAAHLRPAAPGGADP